MTTPNDRYHLAGFTDQEIIAMLQELSALAARLPAEEHDEDGEKINVATRAASMIDALADHLDWHLNGFTGAKLPK